MSKVGPEKIICPYCGSDNVGKSRKPTSAFVVLLLFVGLPFFQMKKDYHCFECYEDFKIDRMPKE